MKTPLLKALKCPKCRKDLFMTDGNSKQDEIDEGALACEKGHTWPIKEGIPSLVFPAITDEDAKWIAEYDEMAENYDELVKQYDDWLGIDMMEERKAFTHYITMEGPLKILDLSIGTAGNFMALHDVFDDQMGRFNLHGLDLSWGMLRVANRKIREKGFEVSLVRANVFRTPYADDFFDAVIHSGGVNTFSDIPGALREMLRITKKGGFVMVVDEGLSPEVRKTERGKEIIKANSLFEAKPPLEHIPEKAKDVELNYVMNGTFYSLVFRK
ncbi:MAG: class I SAM-dependent methyltransferase [Promethearchaeota archaeon]